MSRPRWRIYESLGFVQLPVGDTWKHAYGVVTDGRIVLGLHAYPFDSPALTFVHPGLSMHAPRVRELGVELAFAKLGEEQFHELGFKDPDGQMITLLEARTHSPVGRGPAPGDSQLGHFAEVCLPVADLQRSRAFWEVARRRVLRRLEWPAATHRRAGRRALARPLRAAVRGAGALLHRPCARGAHRPVACRWPGPAESPDAGPRCTRCRAVARARGNAAAC